MIFLSNKRMNEKKKKRRRKENIFINSPLVVCPVSLKIRIFHRLTFEHLEYDTAYVIGALFHLIWLRTIVLYLQESNSMLVQDHEEIEEVHLSENYADFHFHHVQVALKKK